MGEETSCQWKKHRKSVVYAESKRKNKKTTGIILRK